MNRQILWASIFFIFLVQMMPFAAEAPDLFCQELGNNTLECWGIRFKEIYFFFARLGTIFAAVVVYGLALYYKAYKPFKKFEDIRGDILDAILSEAVDVIKEEKCISVRINILKSKRYWWSLGTLWKLTPIFHYGFEPRNRDMHLSFWVFKLFKWEYAQGNCGSAFVNEMPNFADLTKEDPYDYNMPDWKIEKTDYIKGIISIPVFDPNRFKKTIGVLNIDTDDEDVVKKWVENEDLFSYVIEYFEKYAKLISKFM